MGPFFGIILFTVVEVVTLVVWLILAGLPFTGQFEAVAVLAGGLFIEHLVAYNTGAGRPFFSIPE